MPEATETEEPRWSVVPLDPDDEAPEEYISDDVIDGEPVKRMPVDSCDGATRTVAQDDSEEEADG